MRAALTSPMKTRALSPYEKSPMRSSRPHQTSVSSYRISTTTSYAEKAAKGTAVSHTTRKYGSSTCAKARGVARPDGSPPASRQRQGGSEPACGRSTTTVRSSIASAGVGCSSVADDNHEMFERLETLERWIDRLKKKPKLKGNRVLAKSRSEAYLERRSSASPPGRIKRNIRGRVF